MFGFGKNPTRPMTSGPYNPDPTLCGRHVSKTRMCAKPAVWHCLVRSPYSRNGFAGSSACDEHRDTLIPPCLDYHPIRPICYDDNVWWQMSTGPSTGFCYHPHEEEALMNELADINIGIGGTR